MAEGPSRRTALVIKTLEDAHKTSVRGASEPCTMRQQMSDPDSCRQPEKQKRVCANCRPSLKYNNNNNNSEKRGHRMRPDGSLAATQAGKIDKPAVYIHLPLPR